MVYPRVCIVGAGPAGFYAAMHLTKNYPNINIDFIEKLPVPFGLIRYGVAPDHPEVKNVINQFTKVAYHKHVNFYGNLTLGKDISLALLRKHYNAVLLTYGAEQDKLLGIENEDANNIVAARSFVGWYNGHPADTNLKIDLSGQSAAILGQGNVALDVARILLTPVDELRKTDITEHSLNALSESKINEVFLIGRRGPLQVAFTIKELREQIKLKNNRVIWRDSDFIGVPDLVSDLPRPRKRLTELMLKSLHDQSNNVNTTDIKYFKPIFFRSPNKFIIDNNRNVTGIELTCNKLIGETLKEHKVVATNEKSIINCDLAFRSIGYKSLNVDKDIVFNSHGFVENNRGCVIGDASRDLANVYVAGWLGTGPVGVILQTMGNAFQVAKSMCEDLKKNNSIHNKGGFEEIKKIVNQNNIAIVTWDGWTKIDKHEVEQGKKVGKPREKVCSIEKMLEIGNL